MPETKEFYFYITNSKLPIIKKKLGAQGYNYIDRIEDDGESGKRIYFTDMNPLILYSLWQAGYEYAKQYLHK